MGGSSVAPRCTKTQKKNCCGTIKNRHLGKVKLVPPTSPTRTLETATGVGEQSRIMSEAPRSGPKLFGVWCNKALGRWR